MSQPRVSTPGGPEVGKARERLCPTDRVRQRLAYVRCYRAGSKRHGRLLSLHVHRNDENHARLGITASRKVGNAVKRHRLKRWTREVFRRWPARAALRPVDIVVHLKPQAASASHAEFSSELDRLLRAFVLREDNTVRRG